MATQTNYDVFISYSRKDYIDKKKNVIPDNEVSKIKEALTRAGITYWFDEEYVRYGAEFAKVIVKNIKASSLFVFISTHNSNNSEWTAKEIASAHMIGKTIIPVRVDDSIYHDDVLLFIAGLSHIDYNDNPEKGRYDLISTIKEYLKDIEVTPPPTDETEKTRQKRIANWEIEILAEESRRTEFEKVVSQKKQELKKAKDDLESCMNQIRELHNKVKMTIESEVIFNQNNLEIRLGDVVKFKMIHITGNSFMMGATAEQGAEVESIEKPPHEVALSDFYIGETVVTQALWHAVMGNNPSYFRGEELPVESVAWEHQNESVSVQVFIKKLNEILCDQLPKGHCFRLPTEAEWEFAAREGKSRGYKYKYSGSNNINEVAWYAVNSNSMTHPVKEMEPNDLGIYDMNGNVWEWCQDWWGKYSGISQINPKGPDKGVYRVYRGGCWRVSAKNCRISYRYRNVPTFCSNVLGFRLAL